MRRAQTTQTLKLRLLAVVLALALIWYSLNPAPRSISRTEREDEPSDEKRRNVEPRNIPVALPVAFRPAGVAAKSLLSTNNDDDNFEWPEFIDG
jgi:hypothetical protein